MKVIPETCRVHNDKCLRFYFRKAKWNMRYLMESLIMTVKLNRNNLKIK